MSGIVKRNVGDLTYEAVDANIVGGMVCVPSTTVTESGDQGVTPAGANAINVLGVASKDAVTAANRAALTSSTGPAPLSAFLTDASVPGATVTLYNDFFGNVVYASGTAVAYGDAIKAAANGTVTKHVSGTDAPERKIGWCAQKGGVGTGGGVALGRILV
jgi:hypothetical protein